MEIYGGRFADTVVTVLDEFVKDLALDERQMTVLVEFQGRFESALEVHLSKISADKKAEIKYIVRQFKTDNADGIAAFSSAALSVNPDSLKRAMEILNRI